MSRALGRFLVLFLLAYVAAGVAFALGQPVVAVIAFVLLVLASVVSIVWTSARLRSGNAKLARRPDARHGRATILSTDRLALQAKMGEGRRQAGPNVYRLQVRVEVEGQAPYEVRHHEAAHPWAAGHLRPGQVVPCLVHPRKPKVIHLLLDRGDPTFPSAAPGVPTVPMGGVTVPGVVSAPGVGSIDVDGLIRQATGSGLDDLLRRVEAGESVPGVQVTRRDDVRISNVGVSGAPPVPPPPGAPPGYASPGVPPPPGPPPGAALRDGTAVVNAARDIGPGTRGGRRVELDLLVAVPGETPYRVVTVVERSSAPQVGSSLRVRVDPTRPSEVQLPGG